MRTPGDIEQTNRILLMHQSLSDAAGLCAKLRQGRWDILQVIEPLEALQAARAELVDVAVLHLPVGDTIDMDLPNVLRRVATCAYLPVMIVTDCPAERWRCELLDSGADDIVLEATSAAETNSRLRALLRIKQAHDRLDTSRSRLRRALKRERKLLDKLRRDNAHLRDLATTDPLTSAGNLRSFEKALDHEFKMARRYGQSLSLLMVDVDHFKRVNDSFGHGAGDGVLRQLAEIFKRSVRESDVVARTGGDEFGVILPKAGREQARSMAERIRREVFAHSFSFGGPGLHVTVSVGVATFPADARATGPQMLTEFADMALLRAKARRDCVAAFGEKAGLAACPA
ncbi:MAG TPA: diguanylate cyclase [Phycisphaerae bacterium]|nr:diguanylate cyclase [Phycisphaerae bacterium]